MQGLKVAVVAPVTGGSTADAGWLTQFACHLEQCGFDSYDSVYPYEASACAQRLSLVS